MRIFLLVFVALYGGMNYYFFRKVLAAQPGSKLLTALLGVFLLLAIAAPIVVRVFEQGGYSRLAWLAAAVGYLWIAIVFWFCILAALGDGWNLGIQCFAHWKPSASRLLLNPRTALALYGAAILFAIGWGLVEAHNVRLTEVHIKTPRLAAGAPPVRIVEVCDIHLSPILRDRKLAQIIGLISEAKPDIVVFTGDVTDVSYENGKSLAAMLATVKAPLGKFGVLGNHEYFTGLKTSLQFLEAAGIRVLRCESVVAGPVRLAGVDDPAGNATGAECLTDEAIALGGGDDSREPRDRPMILLKHRPAVNPASVGRFDVQLSGHSHGGQIFPFTLMMRYYFPTTPGLHRLGPDCCLYHSRGAGTWGPPLRVLAPPEVTLIVLEPN